MSDFLSRDPGSAKILARNALLALYLFTSIWLIAWFVYGYGYWEDDAFIHLEFARSLSQGRGFSFAGVLTNGDTSPLWVFLLAGAHCLIPDWMVAGKTLLLVSCFAALSALEMLAAKLAPAKFAPRRFAAVMVLLLAVNPYFVFWFLSGMETLMAIAFALWIVWAASVASVNWLNFWFGCLLCGLAPLLRPEFVFLDLIVAPFLIARAWRLTSARSVGARLTVLVLAGLLAAAPLAAWTTYAHEVLGSVIATTSAAKRDPKNGSVLERLAVVLSYGFPLIVVFAVSFPAVAALCSIFSPRAYNNLADRVRSLPWASWIIVAWSLLTCAFYVENQTFVQTR